jgi:hypothetical protein
MPTPLLHRARPALAVKGRGEKLPPALACVSEAWHHESRKRQANAHSRDKEILMASKRQREDSHSPREGACAPFSTRRRASEV